ncbi:hypothetical protein [Nocardiopsis sp. CC223A]|uniref:hypothetical protein n=1 Tax=Nocardiopsis sp. CC223A TaxID=3044051 RepID=UPI0035575956
MSLGHDLLGDAVVDIGREPPLPARQAAQVPVAVADAVDLFAGVDGAVGGGGDPGVDGVTCFGVVLLSVIAWVRKRFLPDLKDSGFLARSC